MVEYNFPPRVGVGVIRAVKMAKYLPNYGWKPVVLSVKLSNGALGFKYLDAEGIPDLKVYYVRELVPLNRLVKRDIHLGWSPSAFLKGLKIIKNEQINAIYSSYPFAANMLVASLLKRVTGIPLLVNYRDLWINSFFPPPPLEFSVQKIMENFVLKSSDAIVTVTPSHIGELKRFFPFIKKVNVVRNGYDPADFESAIPVKFSKFTILHAGDIVGTRVKRFIEFLYALREFRGTDDFQVVLLGRVSPKVRDFVSRLEINNIVKFEGRKPHREAIRWILGANVLLLVAAAEYIPTMKLYEYLASGNFILNIGYEWGEAGKLISKFRAGISVVPDKKEISKAIKDVVYGDLLEKWAGPDRKGIEELSWPKLAEKLASILNSIAR